MADGPKYIEASFSDIDWQAVEARVPSNETLVIAAGLRMEAIEKRDELAHQ